jgi:hypothetical protein
MDLLPTHHYSGYGSTDFLFCVLYRTYDLSATFPEELVSPVQRHEVGPQYLGSWLPAPGQSARNAGRAASTRILLLGSTRCDALFQSTGHTLAPCRAFAAMISSCRGRHRG